MMFIRKGAHRRLFLLLHGLCAAIITSSLVLPAQATAQDPGYSCPASHYDESAVISSVHDGDTIRLEDGRKIRLIGINAPEMARDGKPAQAFAVSARDQLKQLINASDNKVKLVYGKQRLDRYKRTLAHLFTSDNQNLQVSLLQQGLATANTYPPNVAFSECYQQVEETARCESLGIWSDSHYATKKTTDLNVESAGFHIVSGQVERVSETSKGIWLFLHGGLLIGIRPDDQPNFDKENLESLHHQNITVRGWIHPKTKTDKGVKFYMRLRHPSAITPTRATDNVRKC